MKSEYFDPNIPMFTSKRFRHEECGNVRDALIVTRLPEGWVWVCHKCGARGFKPIKGRTPRQIKEYYEVKGRLLIAKEVKLPSDFTYEIPVKGLTWLYRYGIKDEEIKRFRFGYSPGLNRLIMPVFGKDGLIFWQGRYLGEITKNNPKYYNVRARGKEIQFEIFQERDTVVIVEDILSAITVGREVDTVALLGSYITDTLILKLINKNYKRYYVWLDPDKKRESLGFAKRFNMLGGLCKPVLNCPVDPKEVKNIYKYIKED